MKNFLEKIFGRTVGLVTMLGSSALISFSLIGLLTTNITQLVWVAVFGAVVMVGYMLAGMYVMGRGWVS